MPGHLSSRKEFCMQSFCQNRLNVTQKTRSNFFTWRGQFTPQFVDYVLECFAKPGCVIADPFSGSGTVLLEGARRNLRSYGLELNPAAYYMSGCRNRDDIAEQESMTMYKAKHDLCKYSSTFRTGKGYSFTSINDQSSLC